MTRQITAQPLTRETFSDFGQFANLLNPVGERIGVPPIEFFRDLLPQGLGTHAAVSFSVCRVQPRPPIVDVLEYHSFTAETMMALDQDMVVQVGPASHPDQGVPLDRVAAFHVPRGTMVMLRPGVWHHAPFALAAEPMHVLVALPERTYANDCIVINLQPSEQVEIRW